MKIAAGVLAVLLVLVGFNSFYVTGEGQGALVLQFGRVVRTDNAPGLHFKWPLLQQVVRLDNRLLTLDAQPESYATAGKKSVDVDFYVKWRIEDDAAYYRATGGDELQAIQRLNPVVKDALRDAFGARTLRDLVTGGGQAAAAQVRRQADVIARKSMGVAVLDLRIKRIGLPDEVSDAVYKRMRADRMQLASELRSSGQQAAETIRADADRQGQVIRADAERDAARVRGEGEAQAAAIYAQAYGQDPEFFAFYRSLQAYRKAFAHGKSVLLLKPGAGFLRYFGDPSPAKH